MAWINISELKGFLSSKMGLHLNIIPKAYHPVKIPQSVEGLQMSTTSWIISIAFLALFGYIIYLIFFKKEKKFGEK